jgi:hypothetical protein
MNAQVRSVERQVAALRIGKTTSSSGADMNEEEVSLHNILDISGDSFWKCHAI